MDSSTPHIITEIARAVRKSAEGRATIIVAENEPQETSLVRPDTQGGNGLDMLWNDDYHHSASVVLSGHSEAYYADYLGSPQEFISAAKWGYLYQGQRYKWLHPCRGTPRPDALSPLTFVNFLQNHGRVSQVSPRTAMPCGLTHRRGDCEP